MEKTYNFEDPFQFDLALQELEQLKENEINKRDN